MLPKKHKLKKKNDFKAVFKKGNFYRNSFIRMKVLENELGISRFAFVVSLKVSKKAVIRNRIKRFLANAISLEKIKTGFDVVFLTEPDIAEKSQEEIKQAVDYLFDRAKLWK